MPHNPKAAGQLWLFLRKLLLGVDYGIRSGFGVTAILGAVPVRFGVGAPDEFLDT